MSEPQLKGENPAAATILIVDDNEMNREILYKRLQRHDYNLHCAVDGYDALEQLQQHEIDLILLDIMMPRMDGFEVLQKVKSDPRLHHIPVIMITALDEVNSVARCIEMGAEDYLSKPFNPVLLMARVSACLDKKQIHDQEQAYTHNLEARLQEQIDQIAQSQLSTIFATSKLAESKDPETGAHLERMRMYCQVLARDLSLTEKYRDYITDSYIDCIYTASPLHDIGKVGVPDRILSKPGKLDGDEWEIMKTHTTIGGETLRAIDEKHPGNGFIRMGIEIAENHHEKWDGSGYPRGRKGEDIPLSARILALADVYDALTSSRCYKEAFSHDKSKGIILEGRGQHFDPDIVEAFLRCEQTFIDISKRFQDE
ncbi:MAG: response regulator [Thioalkalispiraceae bacterium]|jgi:putative two-component system response regulator